MFISYQSVRTLPEIFLYPRIRKGLSDAESEGEQKRTVS
jgi:hypothetical protein